MLPVNTKVFKNGEIGIKNRKKIRERSPVSKLKRKIKRLKKQMNHLEMAWDDANWRKALFPTAKESHERYGTSAEEVFLGAAFPGIAGAVKTGLELIGAAKPHSDNGQALESSNDDQGLPSVSRKVKAQGVAETAIWKHPSQALSHKVPSARDTREDEMIIHRDQQPDHPQAHRPGAVTASPTALRGPQQSVAGRRDPSYVAAEEHRLAREAAPVSRVPQLSNCPPRSDLMSTPSSTVAAGNSEHKAPLYSGHSQVALL